MAAVHFHKVTALPATLAADSMYFVTAGAEHTEVYVTDSAGSARRIFNEGDVQALINSAVSSLSSLEIVADIAARDSLSLTANAQVLVIDATADSTVSSGAATYAYNHSTAEWHKLAESESMDFVLAWSALQGGPSSTPTQIDAAVAAAHTHANATELGKIGQDANGYLTYDGALPKCGWDTRQW